MNEIKSFFISSYLQNSIGSRMNFVLNEKGIKTSIIVPIKKWEKVIEENKKLKRKIEVLNSIKDGLIEVKDSIENKTKMQTLDELLNEYSN